MKRSAKEKAVSLLAYGGQAPTSGSVILKTSGSLATVYYWRVFRVAYGGRLDADTSFVSKPKALENGRYLAKSRRARLYIYDEDGDIECVEDYSDGAARSGTD